MHFAGRSADRGGWWLQCFRQCGADGGDAALASWTVSQAKGGWLKWQGCRVCVRSQAKLVSLYPYPPRRTRSPVIASLVAGDSLRNHLGRLRSAKLVPVSTAHVIGGPALVHAIARARQRPRQQLHLRSRRPARFYSRGRMRLARQTPLCVQFMSIECLPC